MVLSILREDIIKEYKLKNRQKMDKQELEEIAQVERIELRDLIFLLGGDRLILYKGEKNWTCINLEKDYSIKDRIHFIKLDLRYMEQYGERQYTKEEILYICIFYEVRQEDFLTYIKRKRSCYYDNIEIIERNEAGLWIGKIQRYQTNFLKII